MPMTEAETNELRTSLIDAFYLVPNKNRTVQKLQDLIVESPTINSSLKQKDHELIVEIPVKTDDGRGRLREHFVDLRITRLPADPTGAQESAPKLVSAECFRGDYCGFRTDREYCKHIAKALESIATDKKRSDAFNSLVDSFFDDDVAGVAVSVNNRESVAKKLMGAGLRSFLLYGPTGTGKTLQIMQEFLAKKNEGVLQDVFFIQCSDGQEDIDFLSRTVAMDPAQKLRRFEELKQEFPDLSDAVLSNSLGDWRQTSGLLKQAFYAAQQGPVGIVIDELSRAGRSALNLLLKAMDPVLDKYILQDFVTGETIEVPLGNIVWAATANLGAAYSGANRLDEALLDRFESTVFVDYDTEVEKTLLLGMGLQETLVTKLQETVNTLRTMYKENKVESPLSTRMVKLWGEQIGRGTAPLAAAEQVWLHRIIDKDSRGYPDDVQLKVVRQVVSQGLSTKQKK